MPFVSVTRLRLSSVRFLPAFAWYALRSAAQARGTQGCVGARLRKPRGLTFWTLTAWESESAMTAFRGRAPHRDVMPRLAAWCDEASVAHWIEDAEDWSSWPRAASRLQEFGRLSHVAHPSPDHAQGRIALT